MSVPPVPPPVAVPPDELQRWGRVLDRAVGADCLLACTNRAGELLWAAEGAATRLATLALPACVAPARLSAPDGCAWLLHPLAEADGDAIFHAWARRPDLPESRLGDVAEALADAIASLSDRAVLQRDLDMGARELADRYEELHLIYDVDTLLAHQMPNIDILPEMLNICAMQLDVDICTYVEAASTRVITAENLTKPIGNLDLVEVEMRGNLFRFVQTVREAVALNGVDDSRRRYLFTNMPFKVLAAPIFIGKKMPAILVLLRHEDRTDFSNSDRSMAVVMANQIAGMLHTRRLIDDLNRFSSQLAAALTEAMEAKDPYTRGHSERVQTISVAIAEAMGLAPKQCDSLSWAALLHDIGKIGVPDALLTKPARLLPDEYACVKSHPERSHDILAHVEYFSKEALLGARHHHEYWDGTGYPDGLAELEIPLLARIIAVADTYDSITSSRAYRAGKPHENAMSEIARVSGTQLDPNVVEVFQDICRDMPNGFLSDASESPP